MTADETEQLTEQSRLTPDELHDLALHRLRKQSDFRVHLLIYVLVNTMIVVVWAWTGVGFFWPIFPIVGWGIGVGANAWDAYGRKPVTEERIQREMRRLQH